MRSLAVPTIREPGGPATLPDRARPDAQAGRGEGAAAGAASVPAVTSG